jgi:hypothetical protein
MDVPPGEASDDEVKDVMGGGKDPTEGEAAKANRFTYLLTNENSGPETVWALVNGGNEGMGVQFKEWGNFMGVNYDTMWFDGGGRLAFDDYLEVAQEEAKRAGLDFVGLFNGYKAGSGAGQHLGVAPNVDKNGNETMPDVIRMKVGWVDKDGSVHEAYFDALGRCGNLLSIVQILSKEGTGVETGIETGEETGEETGAETGDETGDETGNETGDETGNETGDETGNEAGLEAKTPNTQSGGEVTRDIDLEGSEETAPVVSEEEARGDASNIGGVAERPGESSGINAPVGGGVDGVGEDQSKGEMNGETEDFSSGVEADEVGNEAQGVAGGEASFGEGGVNGGTGEGISGGTGDQTGGGTSHTNEEEEALVNSGERGAF